MILKPYKLIKNLKFLSYFVLILFSINSFGQVPNAKYLIGIWQNSPEMAAGWSDNYQFFDNGIFQFNYNQMDCQKRIVYLKGDWTLDKDIVVLSVKEELIIEGGKYVESIGSCGSDSTLEGGKKKIKKLINPQIKKIKIMVSKKQYSSEMATDLEHIKLGSTDFYKLKNNPNDYE
jgi:hypothetical protein